MALTNSPLGPASPPSGSSDFGLALGDAGFRMSLQHWVNDGLLTIFFLVVGLEIKREFTVGHLASRRSAALPIAAAIGGMVAPAVLYSSVIPHGPWSHGWGVPMATDTAFAVALIVMMGARVPVELRIFLTAAAIVDDIGAIVVVALFYSGELHFGYLAAAAVITGALALLNRSRVYRRVALHAARRRALGLRPCRRPARDAGRRDPRAVHPDPAAAEPEGADDAGRARSSRPRRARAARCCARPVAAGAAGARCDPRPARIAGRPAAAARRRALELPGAAAVRAGQCRRRAGRRTCSSGHQPLLLAIIAGLVIGKPLGLVLGVRARGPARHRGQAGRVLAGASSRGAGALAGIGFTMSLFIAGQAFPARADFAAAKIAVFAASILSAAIGVAVLWGAGRAIDDDSAVTRPVAMGDSL